MNIDTIVGIDPGASGGLAVWSREKGCKTMRMPKDMSGIRAYMSYLKEICEPIVFLEKLSVRPDDVSIEAGSPNMGKLFRVQRMIANFEQLKTTIEFCGVPFVLVHPMKWQNILHLRIKGSGEEKAVRKRRYRDIAGELYPEITATLWNADAVLIMHFGRYILKNDEKWVAANLPERVEKGLFLDQNSGMESMDKKTYPEETNTPKTGNSAKLTFEEFVELVKEMRHQQRRYSALRRPEILASAQELEKKVDEAVARLTDSQLSLF